MQFFVQHRDASSSSTRPLGLKGTYLSLSGVTDTSLSAQEDDLFSWKLCVTIGTVCVKGLLQAKAKRSPNIGARFCLNAVLGYFIYFLGRTRDLVLLY